MNTVIFDCAEVCVIGDSEFDIIMGHNGFRANQKTGVL